MREVILFGVGSPIVVDYVETLERLGTALVAGVQNRDGPSYLPDDIAPIRPDDIGMALETIPFLAPLFTPAHRMTAVGEAMDRGLEPSEPLIDPTSILPKRIEFGVGTYVNAGCCLSSASRFGRFVLINRGVTIGHDANFGAFVSTGPGTVVAGNVTVGDGAMLGTGCTVLPGIKIGANAIVGAGAIVTRDVPANTLVIGNPARVREKSAVALGA